MASNDGPFLTSGWKVNGGGEERVVIMYSRNHAPNTHLSILFRDVKSVAGGVIVPSEQLQRLLHRRLI